MTEAAAVVAAVLLVILAGFQVALALGAPWGGAAYGGRSARPDGTLPTGLRIASGVAVPILLAAAWTLLAQGGVVSRGPFPDGALRGVTWGIAGYLALNTVGNLASTNRFERLAWGTVSAVLVILAVILAVQGDGPS